MGFFLATTIGDNWRDSGNKAETLIASDVFRYTVEVTHPR
jgi:hypothetical protein